MATLSQASAQWATRPDDERFLSLTDMHAHFDRIRSESRQIVTGSRRLLAQPDSDNVGMRVVGPDGCPYAPTHWSFGQLAQLAEAPAGYLRTLPSPMAADCINFGLQIKRSVEDVGVLIQSNGDHYLRAATGPNYGRVWNTDVLSSLTKRFGDGITGDWRMPGEFGHKVDVTKRNTTLYASDRDMFVFLADETNRIEIPNRRAGAPGTLARGFFLWNSEVGSSTFGLGMFLFDYACSNRTVLGAEEYREIRIRHTASAPDKWLADVTPALESYANGSASTVVEAVKAAQARKVDDVDAFLKARFTARMVAPIKAVHMLEEQRPIETLWDASVAATAYAKSITHQDARVEIERKAGDLLRIAA